ncbi:MAG TPA: isochorismatase family cysteine hydrolase [Lachnospiraceae bacterium]|nr:isochorismatase family cysteine hydrolase [Lachnospiraceae bacterium]
MKRVLIVVDMQNDFIVGSLGTREAQGIVENVKCKIKQYEDRGDTVIFTRDTHTNEYLFTLEGKNLPVEHCIRGTAGWMIADGLEGAQSYIYVDKPSFGWLGWKKLFEENKLDPSEIELCGLCTDICVVSNALILKAVFPETPLSVDASCCAGVTPKTHSAALETMRMCQVTIL